MHHILKLFLVVSTVLLLQQVVAGCGDKNKENEPIPLVTKDTVGVVKIDTVISQILGKNWYYRVYMPISYKQDTAAKYEILYLLHGYSGNQNDWCTNGTINSIIDRLYRDSITREFIIVMPNGMNSWYVDRQGFNDCVNMESAIITELIPQVEAKYRVKPGPENRSIGGLSMGGFGALRLALKYPELFTNIILMSPACYHPQPDAGSNARNSPEFKENGVFSGAIWTSLNYPNYWSTFDVPTNKPHHFYISAGKSDMTGILKAFKIQLPDALKARTEYVTWDTISFAGGHDWPVWRLGVEDALKKIYKR